MSIQMKRNRVEAASGKKMADLVIKNCKIVNVFSKEIIEADVAICNDLIIGIGEYNGTREIDAGGKYVCPGLIDSHLHIESSMVTPVEFAKTVLPYGTTTIIADPHEIANVCGINGIHYMMNQTKDLPINIFFMMPSCVPATMFENNGADLTVEVMAPLKSDERILGLGEVMDYPAVISGNESILKKIDLFDSATIDGHSPGLSGKSLNAYRAAGVATDHECSTIDEVLERIRLGMYIQIREGSAAKNLEQIIKGLLKAGIGFDRCIFCTDDKHLKDIREEGHISYNIRKAIQYGVKPVEAIAMATINAAQCYKLKRLGAIAPGYSADMILLNDLETFDIESVFYRGKLIDNIDNLFSSYPTIEDRNVLNTIRIHEITAEDLIIPLEKDMAVVLSIVPGELLTKKEQMKVRVKDGAFCADESFSKLAVIERHKATGNIGLGIVSGFNIKNGAIAGTVAHDSHNLIVIGDNDGDMLMAVRELKKANGGFVIVSNGCVIDMLELPVAGLMSNFSAAYVEEKLKNMLEAAHKLNINKYIDPFITLSFLALPVIPEIRVTDRGLFDVTQFEFIDINA